MRRPRPRSAAATVLGLALHAALLHGALLHGVLHAQSRPAVASAAAPPAALTAAAETITAAELARHVDVIAHDSVGGRDTPSPGLARTAQYVADQFRALGLAPGASVMPDDTTWIQSYPIPGRQRIDYDTARISFTTKLVRHGRAIVDERGEPMWRTLRLNFLTDAQPARDTAGLPVLTFGSMYAQRGVLVAGRHTVATLRAAQVQDKFVLYVPPADVDSATQRQVVAELIAKNLAVAVVSDEDSATFVRRAAAVRQRPFWLVNQYMRTTVTHGWGVYVRAGALGDVLATLDVDLAEARATVPPTLRRLPGLVAFNIDQRVDTNTVKPIFAPNVVGLLRTANPSARDYIVLSAHLDDSGGPGANDNALGVAGLLALAKALRHSEVRLRRPILFLATSGGRKEFWGARYFLRESQWTHMPFVLNITLDMLGRGARDSVTVAGLGDLEGPVRADWLAVAHPELGLTLVDGGTAIDTTSDQFAFVEAWVPSLYVSNGTHAAPPPGSDTPAQLQLAQAARILQLVFYVTEAAANAERQPHWSVAGRRQRLAVFGE